METVGAHERSWRRRLPAYPDRNTDSAAGDSRYFQYLELQKEADREAECIACLGVDLTVADAKESLDASMRYFLVVLVIGSVGTVFVGLNWRELIAD